MTDAHEALRELEERARACTACRLAETRTTVVFGDGSTDARVMFVGEGPGRNEDLQGVPFVGAAGQLLNRLLEEVDLRREDVYIANVVKCRPPGNRDPRPDEIEACKGYLAEQIRLIDPEVVSTLGNFATKLLLKQQMGITRLRGHAYPWWNRTVVPTFHPAAALRGGESVMSQMREDFLLIEGVLSSTTKMEEQEPEQLGLFG
ncbi:uracil DNA glycosylase superfamily protein [bacterium BMS3Abin02]|nr:uracil DNA glycosylase superfamily protein [bacterium BMS3Abin02]GBE21302.1 uracil DNA glycosylase superfamily protein [bacterium BMS3Bbin01]HDH27160.1 uracil-DNA glycosylase [Actinomycetota bacterium]